MLKYILLLCDLHTVSVLVLVALATRIMEFDKSSERTQEFLTTLSRLQCAYVYVPKHRGLTTLFHTHQNAQFIFHKLTVD